MRVLYKKIRMASYLKKYFFIIVYTVCAISLLGITNEELNYVVKDARTIDQEWLKYRIKKIINQENLSDYHKIAQKIHNINTEYKLLLPLFSQLFTVFKNNQDAPLEEIPFWQQPQNNNPKLINQEIKSKNIKIQNNRPTQTLLSPLERELFNGNTVAKMLWRSYIKNLHEYLNSEIIDPQMINDIFNNTHISVSKEYSNLSVNKKIDILIENISNEVKSQNKLALQKNLEKNKMLYSGILLTLVGLLSLKYKKQLFSVFSPKNKAIVKNYKY